MPPSEVDHGPSPGIAPEWPAPVDTSPNPSETPGCRSGPVGLSPPGPGNLSRTPGPTALHLFSGPHDRADGISGIFRQVGWQARDFDTVNSAALGVEESDLLSDALWVRIITDIKAGNVDAVIAGPVCSTFSRARELPGGPRPLRSASHPYGFKAPYLSDSEVKQVAEGNYFAIKTAQACSAAGASFVFENPEPFPGSPSMFGLHEVAALAERNGVYAVELDQ